MIHLTLEYLFMAGTISAYIYYIFRLTACFVKKKQGILWNIAAFIGIWLTGDMVVFPEDPINIAAMLLLYTATVFLFYGGTNIEKISVVLILFPIMVSVNFITTDLTGLIYFRLTPGGYFLDRLLTWISYMLRVLFWAGIYHGFQKKLSRMAGLMTAKIWLLPDMICTAAFIGSITVISTARIENAWTAYPSCIACIVASLGCIWLCLYIGDAVRQELENENMKLRQSYYEELEQNQLAIRKLRHDMNNHLGIIGSFMETGEYEKALDYFKKLQVAAAAGSRKFCENGLVNAVINAKYNLAEKLDIPCFINMELKKVYDMDDVSLCTIFANLLDNALEAASGIPEKEKRRLSLKARLVGDALCIEVENTFAGEVKEAKGRLVTTKEKAEGHGYGLRSVRDVVELYGGHIQISNEDGIFRVTIWIGHLSGAAA